jgi:membrane-associated phospholipid phosphatase
MTRRGKLALAALFIIVEIVLYALIARLPRPSASLALGIDEAVPFVPWLIVVYVLKPLLLLGALALTWRKPMHYRAMVSGLIAVTAASELVFLIQPTYPPRPAALGDSALERFTAWIYAVDGPANEFPSIHVSQSVFIMLFALSRMARPWAFPAAGLAASIALTTVLVKQHTLLGLLGGLIIGIAAFLVVRKRALPQPAS